MSRLSVLAWSDAQNPGVRHLRLGDRIVIPGGISDPVLGLTHDMRAAQEAVTTAWTYSTGPNGVQGPSGLLGMSWTGTDARVEVERE